MSKLYIINFSRYQNVEYTLWFLEGMMTEKDTVDYKETNKSDEEDFLILCNQGVRGPKDPQLSKSKNVLNWMFKSDWSVFDFLYIYIEKRFNQKN